ncbi:hypothetical protein [Bacillus badius]|uniref:Uncharacterized protein n=1 Tax=Bacillus badius TaxID=1455 RepID=A0ABR5B030_BACBA|nr:hypothetical protein [Bacillus badius]KIL75052.1 hypothetical protein SD78_2121 [Bacillus badius]KIL79966.1 hypothetical protein SD77_2420 [Bacillus badius]KZR60174.1 hypothetical protein A3781_08250 [Bacillus badius]MED4714969.1 hypothetical protein [Bacillus badius]
MKHDFSNRLLFLLKIDLVFIAADAFFTVLPPELALFPHESPLSLQTGGETSSFFSTCFYFIDELDSHFLLFDEVDINFLFIGIYWSNCDFLTRYIPSVSW